MEDSLKKYVNDARASGIADVDIMSALVGSGWEKTQIESLMTGNTPVPSPTSAMAALSASVDTQIAAAALYNPHRYATIGFFFTIVPVALMSMANGKLLEGGEAIRTKMRFLLIAFSIVVVAWFVLLFGNAWYLGRIARDAIGADPLLLLGGDAGVVAGINTKIVAVKSLLKYLSYAFGVVNLAILVAAVRLTNRLEVPAYDAVKKAGRLKKRNPLLLILPGIALMVAYFFLSSPRVLQYAIAIGLHS